MHRAKHQQLHLDRRITEGHVEANQDGVRDRDRPPPRVPLLDQGTVCKASEEPEKADPEPILNLLPFSFIFP